MLVLAFGITASNQLYKEKEKARPRHLCSGIVHEGRMCETLAPCKFCVHVCLRQTWTALSRRDDMHSGIVSLRELMERLTLNFALFSAILQVSGCTTKSKTMHWILFLSEPSFSFPSMSGTSHSSPGFMVPSRFFWRLLVATSTCTDRHLAGRS